MQPKGEILWMVMLLLALLGLGMLYLMNQQLQSIQTNQWHDVAIRLDHETDKVLSQFSTTPSQFPLGATPWKEIHYWPHSPLSAWQNMQAAYHHTYAWGGEVHVVAESVFFNKQKIYRWNALGYHPTGTLIKKQWVVSCDGAMCRRLSCIMW